LTALEDPVAAGPFTFSAIGFTVGATVVATAGFTAAFAVGATAGADFDAGLDAFTAGATTGFAATFAAGAAAGAGFVAVVGFVVVVDFVVVLGFAAAFTAGVGAGFDAELDGFTAGADLVAGVLGAGFPVWPTPSSAALLSLVFCSCTEFMVLRVLSMMLGFCAHAPPTINAVVTIPVMSFIAIPTCSPPLALLRVLLRLPRVQDSSRD
jgi:hypothetical protein